RVDARLAQAEIEYAVVDAREHLVPLVERLDVDRADPLAAPAELGDQVPADEPAAAGDENEAVVVEAHSRVPFRLHQKLIAAEAPGRATGAGAARPIWSKRSPIRSMSNARVAYLHALWARSARRARSPSSSRAPATNASASPGGTTMPERARSTTRAPRFVAG